MFCVKLYWKNPPLEYQPAPFQQSVYDKLHNSIKREVQQALVRPMTLSNSTTNKILNTKDMLAHEYNSSLFWKMMFILKAVLCVPPSYMGKQKI